MASKEAPVQQKANANSVAGSTVPAAPVFAQTSRTSNRALAKLFRSVSSPGPVSGNLTISSPSDAAELEADRIAAEVMRMPDDAIPVRIGSSSPALHRKCAACKDEDETLHRSATGDSPGTAPPIVHQVLSQPGTPLPESTRNYFEPRLGADLSPVRIHTDSLAARSADAVQAKAYTVGPNVVFGTGQYFPDVQTGQHLLAHELTHVVQGGKSASALHRQVDAGAPPTPDPADVGSPSGHNYDDYFEGYFLEADPQKLKPMLAEMVVHRGGDAPAEFLNRYRIHVLQETSEAATIAGVPDEPQASKDAALHSIQAALDTAVQELRAEHDQFLADFETNAKADALAILFENEQDSKREAVRYGITERQIEEWIGDCDAFGCGGTTINSTEYGMPGDSAAGQGLKDAAQVLLSRRQALAQLEREQNRHLHLVPDRYDPEHMGMILEPTPEYHIVGRQIEEKSREYDILRGELSARYPVLAAFSDRTNGTGELEQLAIRGPGRDMAALVGQQISKRIGDIQTVRAALLAGELDVWRLPRVIAVTSGRLAATDPVRQKLVDEHVANAQPSALEAIALMLFNVLMIALAPATGGATLIPLAAVNATAAVIHTKEYLLQSAVAGTAFDKARALSADEPSLFWLAVEIIGVGLDVGAAVAAFGNIARAIRAASAVREASAAEELVANAARATGKESLVQRVVSRFRASRQGGNAGLRAAGATEDEIRKLGQAARNLEEEAASAPRARAGSGRLEASVTRDGHVFCRSSPNLPCRLKYAPVLADEPALEIRLNQLEAAAREAKTTQEAERIAQGAVDLQSELEPKLWQALRHEAESPMRRQAVGGFRAQSARSGDFEVISMEGPIGDQIAQTESMAHYTPKLPGEHGAHGIGMQLGDNIPEGIVSAPPRLNTSELKKFENALRAVADRAAVEGGTVETNTVLRVLYRTVNGEEVPVLVGVDRQGWIRFPGSDSTFTFAEFAADIDAVTRQVTVKQMTVIRPRK